MKKIAFDIATTDIINGEWFKNWNSLGIFTVYSAAETALEFSEEKVYIACMENPTLLLVHQNRCDDFGHIRAQNLIAKCQNLFIMYVSGSSSGAEPDDISVSTHRIHYSKRVVPTRKELSYLNSLFNKLCSDLERAGSIKESIIRAWNSWEFPIVTILLSILAPLNQIEGDLLLANRVASDILMQLNTNDLHSAALEIFRHGDSGEKEFSRMLEYGQINGPALLSLIEQYPTLLRELARRFL